MISYVNNALYTVRLPASSRADRSPTVCNSSSSIYDIVLCCPKQPKLTLYTFHQVCTDYSYITAWHCIQTLLFVSDTSEPPVCKHVYEFVMSQSTMHLQYSNSYYPAVGMPRPSPFDVKKIPVICSNPKIILES